MMSYSDIAAISRKAAEEAARRKKRPFVPFDEKEIRDRKFKIPFLGDYVPKGWTKIEELFVDISGFGSPGEPALTQDQLADKMVERLAEEKTYGYALIEHGQFQGYVGVYVKEE